MATTFTTTTTTTTATTLFTILVITTALLLQTSKVSVFAADQGVDPRMSKVTVECYRDYETIGAHCGGIVHMPIHGVGSKPIPAECCLHLRRYHCMLNTSKLPAYANCTEGLAIVFGMLVDNAAKADCTAQKQGCGDVTKSGAPGGNARSARWSLEVTGALMAVAVLLAGMVRF